MRPKTAWGQTPPARDGNPQRHWSNGANRVQLIWLGVYWHWSSRSEVLMRRRVFAVLLLVCIGVQPALAARRRGAKLYPVKETTADMSGMNRIFLGWVDLKEDAWALYGYSSQAEWASMVTGFNIQFLGLCQAKLPGGKTVVGARDIGDENLAGYNLYKIGRASC